MHATPSILVVDDTPSNLRALAGLLSPSYDIRVATRGDDALDAVASDAPDLILLDILMPDMDGYAVCRELKRRPRSCDIPVIFITSKDETEDETHGFEVGAADYITKPFDGQVVLARVRRQLAVKARIDELHRQRSGQTVHETNLFRWTSDGWQVRFQSAAPFVLSDTPGACYLMHLLLYPGRYFPVEELVFHLSPQERSHFLADARQMLDAHTLRHYSVQVDKLQAQRHDALDQGDLTMLRQAQAGMDWVVGELKRAGALGKDKRFLSPDRERMRKSVGSAIRHCLAEIAEHDQHLGQHLHFPRLRMGYELVYEPGNGAEWRMN
ncbi:hypothetical protein GCM10027277_29060 [Pseudoduganella ginsengisoli]|uniref:response regulator n=1 Tax=Pseudoduganella ginsengisoli TaxID=1462440 RepID=UPI001BA9F8F6